MSEKKSATIIASSCQVFDSFSSDSKNNSISVNGSEGAK
jgi:hypothetical protein